MQFENVQRTLGCAYRRRRFSSVPDLWDAFSMTENGPLLYATAASVAVIHTLLGPDHYLPFVALSNAQNWSPSKTVRVTCLCGVGHVLGSLLIGAIGVAVGVGLFTLENVETVRGDLAGWLLITSGLVYFVWGVRHAIRRRPHTHLHAHLDGTMHSHEHSHDHEHAHVHRTSTGGKTATPWVLFVIFILGPCEPLIPLLMYPAAKGSVAEVVIVTLVFAAGTITTMVTLVMLGCRAVSLRPFAAADRFGHAVAGFVVLVCGLAVKTGL